MAQSASALMWVVGKAAPRPGLPHPLPYEAGGLHWMATEAPSLGLPVTLRSWVLQRVQPWLCGKGMVMEEEVEGKEGSFRPCQLGTSTRCGTSARGRQAEVRGWGFKRGKIRSAIWFLSGG